jgi:hypothetical protein
MSRLWLFNAAVTAAMLVATHVSYAQNEYHPSPVAPPLHGAVGIPSNPVGPVPGLEGSGSSSESDYPTAVRCAQVHGQAQLRSGAVLTPDDRRLLQQCGLMGSPASAAPGTAAVPPR